MTDRFRPDAALRGITPPVDRGLNRRGDRLVIDDPHAAADAVKRAIADAIKDGAVGGIRKAVNRHLGEVLSSPTYLSEVNKDRSGRHGSEVA